MAKKRTPPLSVFIACEGSNTEPLYFEKLNEIMEDEDNYPYAITVYPDKEVDENPKTDAIGLVLNAKKILMNCGLFLIKTVTPNTKKRLS